MGRKSTFTQAKAQTIVDRLSKGEPLAVICRAKGMPGVQTVYDWIEAHADFAVAYARARANGFDAIAAECFEIANTPVEGVETVERDGVLEERRGDMLGHRRLQIDTRLKLLAKWDPKRYGDRVTQEHTGPGGEPVNFKVTLVGPDS